MPILDAGVPGRGLVRSLSCTPPSSPSALSASQSLSDGSLFFWQSVGEKLSATPSATSKQVGTWCCGVSEQESRVSTLPCAQGHPLQMSQFLVGRTAPLLTRLALSLLCESAPRAHCVLVLAGRIPIPDPRKHLAERWPAPVCGGHQSGAGAGSGLRPALYGTLLTPVKATWAADAGTSWRPSFLLGSLSLATAASS